MIYCLTGKIVKKSMNAVVLSCGGVGYYAQCPASVAGALPGVGREATIYTVMSVTENDVSLYGSITLRMARPTLGPTPDTAVSISKQACCSSVAKP